MLSAFLLLAGILRPVALTARLILFWGRGASVDITGVEVPPATRRFFLFMVLIAVLDLQFYVACERPTVTLVQFGEVVDGKTKWVHHSNIQ